MQTFTGQALEREEILHEPIPNIDSGVLSITPSSFQFYPANLRTVLHLPRHFQPLCPTFNPLPAEGVSQRLQVFEQELNTFLAQHGKPGWRVIFSPRLLEIFREFESRIGQLPAESPHPLRMLGMLLNKALIGPATMHLDLHNGCNAKCVYCWFHSPTSDQRFGPEWKKEKMPPETFYPLIEDLARLGGKEDLLFSGKGEPLLHPQIFDYLRFAKEKGFQITLFTNGKLLKPHVIEFLIEHQIDRLYISLSAASPQIYPHINPSGSREDFEQIVKQLDTLANLKQKSPAPAPEVFLVSVLNTLNIHEMPDFAQMAKDRQFEFVRFQLLHVQSYNSHLAILPDQFQRLHSNLQVIEQNLAGTGTRINHNIYTQMNTVDPHSGSWFEGKLPQAGCSVGYDFSRVWTNGDVSFCCSPKVMGNVAQGGFEKLWRSDSAQSLRTAAMHLDSDTKKTFANGTTLLGDHCYSCPNYEGVDFTTKRAQELFPRSYVFKG